MIIDFKCLAAAAMVLWGSWAWCQDSEDFRPDQSRLLAPPPENAIVLFDGTKARFRSMRGEAIDWPIEDGCLVSTRSEGRVNHIVSEWHFRDADVHVDHAFHDRLIITDIISVVIIW